MSPTNSMIMMKLGGYSVLDLCWYRQQGTNIFMQPMTVVESIWMAPGKHKTDNAHLQHEYKNQLCQLELQWWPNTDIYFVLSQQDQQK